MEGEGSNALGKIDNLIKRGIILVDWCRMCKRGGNEIPDYLLLHCPVTHLPGSYDCFCDVQCKVGYAQICAYDATILEKKTKLLQT